MAIEPILIPEERKAVLIGKNGRTKAYIEKMTHTKLHIGDGVEIEGEPIGVITAHDIVLAIGRGFTPKDALMLLDEEYGIDIISLRAETKNSEKRLLARVIGKKGSSRKTIEEETGARIRVYGKTVSIIGTSEQLESAHSAVELLIKGKTHAYVFKRLRKGR